jgi:hypothetical protein
MPDRWPPGQWTAGGRDDLPRGAATAARACRSYARAADGYQRAAPLVAVGAGDIQDLPQAAAEHQGNGSNGLRQAEVEATLAIA